MTPTIIEKAFANAVAPDLEIERQGGVDWNKTAADCPSLVVRCESLENVAGSLWKATVKLRLEWPSFGEGSIQLKQFSSAELALSEWLSNPANINGLDLPAGRIAGHKLTTSDPQTPHDDRWATEFAFVVGVDCSGS